MKRILLALFISAILSIFTSGCAHSNENDSQKQAFCDREIYRKLPSCHVNNFYGNPQIDADFDFEQIQN